MRRSTIQNAEIKSSMKRQILCSSYARLTGSSLMFLLGRNCEELTMDREILSSLVVNLAAQIDSWLSCVVSVELRSTWD